MCLTTHPRFFFMLLRKVLQLLAYLSSDACKLLGSECELGIAKQHIALLLQGDEVDVSMGNLHTEYCHTYTLARESSLLRTSYLLSTCQLIVFEVIDVVNLTLRDHQCVTLYHGIDVEESKILVVLCYLIARNLSSYDSAKNACHSRYAMLMLSTSRLIIPPGVLMSAISPGFLPSKPCAMGVFTEILPALRLASLSGTIA